MGNYHVDVMLLLLRFAGKQIETITQSKIVNSIIIEVQEDLSRWQHWQRNSDVSSHVVPRPDDQSQIHIRLITRYCVVKVNVRLDSNILASRFSTLRKSVHGVERRFTIGHGHRVGVRYIRCDIITHYFSQVISSGASDWKKIVSAPSYRADIYPSTDLAYVTCVARTYKIKLTTLSNYLLYELLNRWIGNIWELYMSASRLSQNYKPLN